MDDMYIPNFMSFHNENTFLGSWHGLRFKLTPDIGEMTIRAEYWFGPLCYEKSKMDGERMFALSDQGIEEMREFLLSLEPV